MQIQLQESTLTQSPEGITTEGTYYSYLNGYMYKQTTRHYINKKDYLNAKTIRDRSKRTMFVFIAIGAVFMGFYSWLVSQIQSFFNIQNIFDIFDRIERAVGFMEWLRSATFGAVIIIITVVTISAYVILIKYLLSNRRYLEITYIGGTIRMRYTKEQEAEVKAFIKTLNDMQVSK